MKNFEFFITTFSEFQMFMFSTHIIRIKYFHVINRYIRLIIHLQLFSLAILIHNEIKKTTKN